MLFKKKDITSIIYRLLYKAQQKNLTKYQQQEQISLLSITLFAKSFANALLKDLRAEQFRFSNLPEKWIFKNKKKRAIYPLTITDKIVQILLIEKLQRTTLQFLSPHCYSYRSDINHFTAIKEFAAYLKKHKEKDIFVIKSDIRDYTDNIPIGENSELWTILKKLLEFNFSNIDIYFNELITAAIRPQIKRNNVLYQKYIGVAMGTPISTLIANLYLTEVDRTISAIPEIFYARYGDDILIAHNNINQITEARETLTSLLQRLQLPTQLNKEHQLYLTRAGKSYVALTWQGTTRVEYLGFSINRLGNITISARRFKLAWQRLQTRIDNHHQNTQLTAVSQQCQSLCNLINQLSDINDILHDKYLMDFIRITDDRALLKQLDYLIAKKIAEKVSGKTGVRAFRNIPYQELRQKYQLKSLVMIKNSI